MNRKICLIDRSRGTAPVEFGKARLAEALCARGAELVSARFWPETFGGDLYLVCGETSSRLMEMLLSENGLTPRNDPEGVIFRRCRTEKGTVLAVAGTDERGLMYALLELADRVRCGGAVALEKVEDLEEYPDNRVRGVDRFVMSSRDESWLYSADFWNGFLARIAANRFNRFTLILGFDTAYMTPLYPSFTEVPGYPGVTVRDLTPEGREKNLAALREIARLCTAYGIEFFLATWQQLPWTDTQDFLVKGLPEDPVEFADYCAAGMRTILEACPGIRGVQLRVNLEAGVHVDPDADSEDQTNTAEAFWNTMVDAIASVGRPIKLDIRAKGLTEGVLDHALKAGLDVCVPTKYWCEHVALPYHIPQMRTEEMAHLNNANSSRRYSYDNLLKKPHWYDVIYRLWNYGSTNLFLWGSPEYARRFAQSCALMGGAGFTINTPLSLKGGQQFIPGPDWPIHINPELIDYTWEDERYWAYYLSFGRYGYDTKAGDDLWAREFNLRFGALSETAQRAYRAASTILPLVTTAHFPAHPSLHYWPELYAGAALFEEHNREPFFKGIDYGKALPSDETFFESVEQFIDDPDAEKYSPLLVRDWLKALADRVRETLAALDAVPDKTPEQKAMLVDFAMTADIAEFHAWKIKAAYHLALFRKNGEKAELPSALSAMRSAAAFWTHLSGLGNENYAHNLEFDAGESTNRNGNWQEFLEKEVLPDAAELERLLTENGLSPADAVPAPYRSMAGAFEETRFSDDVPKRAPAGRDLEIRLRWEGAEPARMNLSFRHTNQREGYYRKIPMKKAAGVFSAVIPADYLTPEWDLIVFFSGKTAEGETILHPGVTLDDFRTPYYVVTIGEEK